MSKSKSRHHRNRKPTVTFGAKPSPHDTRDWVFETLRRVSSGKSLLKSLVKAETLPPKLDLRESLPRVYDQGLMPICAAVVAATCKSWQESALQVNSYSAMFVYNHRVNYGEDGMHGRDVMEILKGKGCCLEREFKTTQSNMKSPSQMRPNVKDAALPYRIRSYARVTTVNGLKQALNKYGPCYISFPIYNSLRSEFWRNNGKDAVGGHAVTVVGYDDAKQCFVMRNSWGIFWGKFGYSNYPYADFGAHWDLFSMVDDDTTPPPLPYVPPPPNDDIKKICGGLMSKCVIL